jgi:hypothetical protein
MSLALRCYYLRANAKKEETALSSDVSSNVQSISKEGCERDDGEGHELNVEELTDQEDRAFRYTL